MVTAESSFALSPTLASFWHRRIGGIKVIEYAGVFLLYFAFSLGYHITLWISTLSFRPGTTYLFSVYEYFQQPGINYLLMGFLSIPIWWLMFRKLRKVKLSYRLLLHMLILPLFTYVFQVLFYTIADYFGWGHLRGYGQVWDIYIPGLFYIIQFSIYHAYEHYHDNQRNLKMQAELSQAALKSELSALKAQLNPHFLYNVFNTISASVPPEQEQTRELIAQLSDLFRYQLKASRTEKVPLYEELAFVEKYLALEKARFEDRLTVTIDVPPEIRSRLVPPMILQPLVENSIKHGLSSLIDGGSVAIRARQVGEEIQFEVADTGVGVPDKSKLFNGGVGLTNTKLRLEKQYGSKMRFTDNQPRGLKVEFAI